MRLLALVLLSTMLAACGGGSSSNDQPATGTFTLGVTDGAIDDYQEALLEVSSITLIGAGGQETQVLDTPQIIDLLKLRNVSELLLRERLTARKISKIRLGVESIELRKIAVDGTLIAVDRPPVPTRKIDLNPQNPLEIKAGQDLLVFIDFDLHNSVKITNSGPDKVRFRPLVKIVATASQLVRLYGTYTVNGSETSICDLERVSDADGVYDMLDICVALDESLATYFGADGLPLNNSDPTDPGDLAHGEKVSVYGYYQQTAGGDQLAAEIIARGTGTRGQAFTTLNGIVETSLDASSGRYVLGLTELTSIPVALSDGAKVFNLDGDLIDPETITAGRRAEARGALTDSGSTDPDWLQAFVTFLGGLGSNETTGGMVTGITGGTLTLDTTTAPACVVTSADTEFYEITSGGGITETSRITLADITSGTTIEASGDRVGDCIQASTVIVEI